MRKSIAAAGILVLLITLAEPAAAQAPTDETHHETEVRQVWAELDRLWNARDADAFTALFTREASFVFVDRGEALEGNDRILERFSAQFPAMPPDLRHRTAISGVRSISNGALGVDGTVEVLRVGGEEGREPEVLLTFAIFGVMMREAEGWRIGILRVVELPDEPRG